MNLDIVGRHSIVLGSASDLFLDFDPQQRFVIVLVIFGCALGLTITLAGIAAGVYSSVHRRRIEEGLKRDMLDRGMSADEIVKVIERPLRRKTQRDAGSPVGAERGSRAF